MTVDDRRRGPCRIPSCSASSTSATDERENIDRILDRANDEERDPSESERELIDRYRDRLQQLEPQIGELLDLEETREQGPRRPRGA